MVWLLLSFTSFFILRERISITRRRNGSVISSLLQPSPWELSTTAIRTWGDLFHMESHWELVSSSACLEGSLQGPLRYSCLQLLTPVWHKKSLKRHRKK